MENITMQEARLQALRHASHEAHRLESYHRDAAARWRDQARRALDQARVSIHQVTHRL